VELVSSVDLRGSARTLDFGVLEEVLFLVSLFNLSKEGQHTALKRLEQSLTCSDMALVLRISTRDSGGRIDRLGLSHKQTVQPSESPENRPT
jgi:hypothetical protein